jgi:hypothetical protein
VRHRRLSVLQAPPCDLPLLFGAAKTKPRGRSGKVPEEQQKLDSGHQLTVEQYQKLRYSMPAEVTHAVLGMDDHGGASEADECILLRLNVGAFMVHFRHDACSSFVTQAHGEAVGKVRCMHAARLRAARMHLRAHA